MKLGIAIPKDLAIVAFDETEAYELFSVPLSYVSQPLSDIGIAAVELLHDKITDPLLPFQSIVLSAQMHIKDSSQAKN